MSTAISAEKKLAIHQAINIDGLTFGRAANHFGLTVDQTKEIFDEASEEYAKRFINRNESRRQLQDDRWEEFRRINLEHFKKSAKPKRTKIKRTNEDGEVSIEMKVEERLPEKGFMKLAMEATQKVSDLWGLEAPKQTQNVSHTTHEFILSMEGMSDEQLAQQALISQLVDQKVIVLDQPKAIENAPAF